METQKLVDYIQSLFGIESIKSTYLEPYWYEQNQLLKIDSVGFCGFACLLFLEKITDPNWEIYCIYKSVWDLGGHSYLRHKKTQEIIDMTACQYELRGIRIPYELGEKGCPNYSNKAKISPQIWRNFQP